MNLFDIFTKCDNQRVCDESGIRLANVVTSLQTKHLHKSSFISHPRSPFWVTVCMTSVNGTETKVIYALCSTHSSCFTIVLCNKHIVNQFFQMDV